MIKNMTIYLRVHCLAIMAFLIGGWSSPQNKFHDDGKQN